jgi:hypothetical protein
VQYSTRPGMAHGLLVLRVFFTVNRTPGLVDILRQVVKVCPFTP